MTAAETMWKMLYRARVLADRSMDELRTIAVGFGCDNQPSTYEARGQTRGQTRGELIETILSYEFDRELTEDQQ